MVHCGPVWSVLVMTHSSFFIRGNGGFFIIKISKVPKTIMMDGDVNSLVRCTQHTFSWFLKGPILHPRPFKNMLTFVLCNVFEMLFNLCHQISAKKGSGEKKNLF